MKKYDVKCPFCGTVNKNLFLDETHGWMICEKCQRDSISYSYMMKGLTKIPVLTYEQLSSMAKAGAFAG